MLGIAAHECGDGLLPHRLLLDKGQGETWEVSQWVSCSGRRAQRGVVYVKDEAEDEEGKEEEEEVEHEYIMDGLIVKISEGNQADQVWPGMQPQ